MDQLSTLSSIEDYAKANCPEAFEKWDGTKITVIFMEDRGGDKVKETCAVHLMDEDNNTHAVMNINPETDKIRIIFLAD